MKNKTLSIGQFKTKNKFLLLPMTIDNETRFFCFVKVHYQVMRKISLLNTSRLVWVAVGFDSKKQEKSDIKITMARRSDRIGSQNKR